MPVKISSGHQFRGYKLGLITEPCKNDDGIIVFLTNSEDGLAHYVCIQTERGDTIEILSKNA